MRFRTATDWNDFLECSTVLWQFVFLEKDRNIHLVKLGLANRVFVGTAVLDVYSKYGDIESSKHLLFRMLPTNAIFWIVMIQGLADCGFGLRK